MKVLIVHAHYEPKSFTTALKDTAAERLTQSGHIVTISDLYQMSFDPVAKKEDFCAPQNPEYIVYSLEQRHGWETGTIAPDIRQELGKLLAADLLILNFPIFWFSTPAILKGWIDRVLLSGICFGGRRFYDKGGLRGKRALVTVTLGGRQHMFGDNSVHGPLETMLRHLLRGTLAYVGMDVLAPFVAWHVPYISPEDRAAFLRAYEARLETVFSESPLPICPSLDDFDSVMLPLRP